MLGGKRPNCGVGLAVPYGRNVHPGQIIEGRRSYNAQTALDALRAAKAWIEDSEHNASHLRVVDEHGTVIFDKRVTEVVYAPRP